MGKELCYNLYTPKGVGTYRPLSNNQVIKTNSAVIRFISAVIRLVESTLSLFLFLAISIPLSFIFMFVAPLTRHIYYTTVAV